MEIEGPFPPFEPDGPGDNGKSGGNGRLRDIPLRFVLPNIITVLAICAGMTGVRLAFEGRFDDAVLMVLLAAVLDGVDGRVARLVKGSSKFGAEMDSLADIVNFGVAPALVLYVFVLDQAGSLGWIAALLYAIACGLRLARFNVMMENRDRPVWQGAYFTGVPAPAGAFLVLLPVYLGILGIEPETYYASAVSCYTLLVGFLLVVRRCSLDRVPGIAEVHESDSLHNTPALDVQAGNDALCQHRASSWSASRRLTRPV